MFVKSFQKQIQKIFSLAAFKTTGLYIDCLSTALPQSPLSFNIDIAQRMYRNYELTNFKFCQKGTTPRSIAQEIAIFTHENAFYSFGIDSFGLITISPSAIFYKKMKESILSLGKIHHTALLGKVDTSQSQKENQKFLIYYRLEDSSLSSLRVIKQLQLFADLKLKLNQYPTSKIRKIVDLTSNSLSPQQLQEILKYEVIDVTNYDSTFFLPKATQKDYLFVLKNKGLNATFQLKRKRSDILIAGCLRHRYIEFLNYSSGIVNQNNDSIIKVGQVFPNIKLSQLHKAKQTNNQVFKIISYCLKMDSLLPIDLRKISPKSHFPLSGVKQSLRGRNSSETILLLLQSISGGKAIQSLQFLLQARERGVHSKQQQIYDIFIKDLLQLLN